MFRRWLSKRKTIEAHQVALVAAAFALDLDWNGERPSVKSDDRWPRFSTQLEKTLLDKVDCRVLDNEQVYFQAFVIERCLDSVRTTDAGLANTLFDAWDYYLRTLPSAHGVTFDYDIWAGRKQEYLAAWSTVLDQLSANPKLPQNPYLGLAAYMFEHLCGLSPWSPGPMIAGMIASRMASAFAQVVCNWTIDRP
jgi:hypothetical protein